MSHYTAQYIKVYLPGLYFMALQNAQMKFLCSLGKTFVPMLSYGIGMMIHPFWCYLLVLKWDMKINGIGLADVITNLSVLSINIWYSS